MPKPVTIGTYHSRHNHDRLVEVIGVYKGTGRQSPFTVIEYRNMRGQVEQQSRREFIKHFERDPALRVRTEDGRSFACRVERTADPPGHGGPRWEVLSPEGFRFNEDAHSMLCYDMEDVRDRCAAARLTPCPPDCACGWPS